MPSYTTTFSLKTIQFNFVDGVVDTTASFTKALVNDDDPEDTSVLPGMGVPFALPQDLLDQVVALVTDAHEEKVAQIASTRAASKAGALAKGAQG